MEPSEEATQKQEHGQRVPFGFEPCAKCTTPQFCDAYECSEMAEQTLIYYRPLIQDAKDKIQWLCDDIAACAFLRFDGNVDDLMTTLRDELNTLVFYYSHIDHRKL